MLLASIAVKAQNIQINCSFQRATVSADYSCHLSSIVVREQQDVIIGGNHLPGHSNDDVVFVRILDSDIPFIIKQIFTTFPNLERLQITRVGLIKIQPNAFVDARNLKNLIINENPLTVIPQAAFIGISGLNELDLRSNSITALHFNAFIGLSQLIDLHLGFNQIYELPDNVFRPLTGLINIHLDSNKLERLYAKDFSHNIRLRQLRFPNNRIYAIERTFFDSLAEALLYVFSQNVCINGSFLFLSRELLLENLRVCIENFEANLLV